MIAASALMLATYILYREMGIWTPTLKHYTKYEEKDLRSCAKDMWVIFCDIEECSLTMIRKKFMTGKFNKVALTRLM